MTARSIGAYSASVSSAPSPKAIAPPRANTRRSRDACGATHITSSASACPTTTKIIVRCVYAPNPAATPYTMKYFVRPVVAPRISAHIATIAKNAMAL